MFVGRRSQRTSESARRIAVRSGFVGHRSPRVAKNATVPDRRSHKADHGGGSAADMAVFCPSQNARGTTLGQLLGQISDVLSTAYAICPKISQKSIKPHFPFSILRFLFSWRRLAVDNGFA